MPLVRAVDLSDRSCPVIPCLSVSTAGEPPLQEKSNTYHQSIHNVTGSAESCKTTQAEHKQFLTIASDEVLADLVTVLRLLTEKVVFCAVVQRLSGGEGFSVCCADHQLFRGGGALSAALRSTGGATASSESHTSLTSFTLYPMLIRRQPDEGNAKQLSPTLPTKRND